MSLEEHKRAERAQAIGLFRYRLICPALAQGLSSKQRGRLVRQIAAAHHVDPFGNPIVVSRTTIDRWMRRYRSGGFEALVPSPRLLTARTDAQVLELAASLKRENPARTVTQVARILRTATGWAPSESTLLRHFHRLDLMGPAAGGAGEVFGRFEASDPNELWCGDALHGPRVGDRKTYLFAFIDDHTRLLTGYRFGYAEDTVRLAAALRPALAARGVPGMVYVDNGSAYSDAWLLRACAKLGIRLTHSTPGRPQGRGKIERFFRTVREQFLVEVTDTTAEDLAAAGVDHATALLELNRLFTAWIETEYHRRIHTETGQSPLARWESGWDRLGRTPAMPTAADLTEAFLWSEYRTVTKTATVSLHSNIYLVDTALAGRRVELVFSPFDLETVEVRHRDRSYGQALPHTISRHAHPKAKPETPQPVARPTGIDYLALTAATHDRALRADQRIGYHALYISSHDDETPTQPSTEAGIA
ncbi:DDE-type integrase/transposase/recombinase [Nocardia sp. NPDC059246]|uniref:DDE-type integrase/transposase/recombinase n=1 Tax=unclassified Nocardia TaxID=2637762 RepID=UPI0036772A2C